jgi:hypothetical protein
MIVRDANDYEDLLAQWSDLESGLGIILSHPYSSEEFVTRVCQYDRWMQSLMQRDPDVGLYLLFQLAGNSPVGYSASHSLVCGVLCHMIAAELRLESAERDSMVHAALTMNIGMTALQDELATQAERPSKSQQDQIRAHTVNGAMMLANLGVTDETWLDIVSAHHDDSFDTVSLEYLTPIERLTRVLKLVDRYSAMISPRMSRAGRTATESARSVMANASADTDEIGHAVVKVIGLCPPGTYVRLTNEELAIVVLRNNATPNQPHVVIVGKPDGELLTVPRLHNTAANDPQIQEALAASAVRAQFNHFHILKLGAYAALQA